MNVEYMFLFIEQADTKSFMEECRKSTNASDEEIKSIASRKPLETRGSKCFLACTYTVFGIVWHIEGGVRPCIYCLDFAIFLFQWTMKILCICAPKVTKTSKYYIFSINFDFCQIYQILDQGWKNSSRGNQKNYQRKNENT